jgi:hypothetical protein
LCHHRGRCLTDRLHLWRTQEQRVPWSALSQRSELAPQGDLRSSGSCRPVGRDCCGSPACPVRFSFLFENPRKNPELFDSPIDGTKTRPSDTGETSVNQLSARAFLPLASVAFAPVLKGDDHVSTNLQRHRLRGEHREDLSRGNDSIVPVGNGIRPRGRNWGGHRLRPWLSGRLRL